MQRNIAATDGEHVVQGQDGFLAITKVLVFVVLRNQADQQLVVLVPVIAEILAEHPVRIPEEVQPVRAHRRESLLDIGEREQVQQARLHLDAAARLVDIRNDQPASDPQRDRHPLFRIEILKVQRIVIQLEERVSAPVGRRVVIHSRADVRRHGQGHMAQDAVGSGNVAVVPGDLTGRHVRRGVHARRTANPVTQPDLRQQPTARLQYQVVQLGSLLRDLVLDRGLALRARANHFVLQTHQARVTLVPEVMKTAVQELDDRARVFQLAREKNGWRPESS